MKSKLLWVLFTLLFISCSKEKETATDISNDIIPANSVELYDGDFVSAAHPTSGKARIVSAEGKWYLVLENFSTDRGPDLKLYLSSNRGAAQFVNLGNLKSTNGQQVYAISGMPDPKEYPYVLIWCQQFSVLFGVARLS
ncbi:DM13 domain-containing protein [Flavihumibacter sp. RY-1]|uniref:DM13 domain-containing protein n=1 Tax=Flavihumibacter fluminis TaxID=2909236 RepID=A0ABS9BGQ8_9BACT|nr:DM13 domain-containing protein [Flavihumibacter fluminis]MCF1714876.1 DM13 domain-containing protein [Flavihumibacter fluminis]